MKQSMFKDRAFLRTLATLMIPMVAQNLISLAAQMMDSLIIWVILLKETIKATHTAANQSFANYLHQN